MKTGRCVTVVIPSYNSGKFVCKAVESVLRQTYGGPLEIILVDDGSTDDTSVAVAPFLNRIRYVCQPNSGLSSARNRGIREAKGDFVAFLDADDEWLPDKLERQCELFERCPEVQMIHTDAYQLYEPEGRQVYVDQGKARFEGRCYTELFRGNRITVSSVLVRRSCLQEVGIFDEGIRGPSTQDWDLWLRVARGYAIGFVSEPLVIYRHHASSGSRDRRMMIEDEYFVLRKVLRLDPSLWMRLGSGTVRARMFGAAFEAGYANAEVGDLRRARRYCSEALAYKPWRRSAWRLWVSTFLPTRVRKRVRSMLQRVAL